MSFHPTFQKNPLRAMLVLGGLWLCGFGAMDALRLVYPKYFPRPVYDFGQNPLAEAKISLGKALFSDPILSADSSTSCASCHSPYNAFAHTDHDLSHGIGDQIGTRNAPPLFNLAWQGRFMWDGTIHNLDVQALAPISHPKEMGEDLKHVLAKLRRTARYPQLFRRAFGDSSLTGERVLRALAQYQLTLVSAQAKYDSVRQGKAAFSEQEQRGYTLFLQHCNSCHAEPLFSTYGFANNGLPVDTTLNDVGRGGITHLAADSLQFKIPSLRNLRYTYPYMHDGRFKKLHQVLAHYAKGIGTEARIDARLRGGLPLSPENRADIIAFLLTLDDARFTLGK